MDRETQLKIWIEQKQARINIGKITNSKTLKYAKIDIKRWKKELIPAIPPEDYKGSVGKWMIGLQERGLWDGENPDWHGDVMITSDQWLELLEACE